MRAPGFLAIPTMVVRVPWSSEGTRFKTLIDAAMATRESGQSVWFVLEDGKLLAPRQVADLRNACVDGSILADEVKWTANGATWDHSRK